MAQVNKSTMIGELLQIDQNIAPILLNIPKRHSYESRNALPWMPIFPDGNN